MSATTVGPHATSRDPEAPPSDAHDHDNPHDHDPDDLDATTVAEPRSETVSLTDQTNLLPRKKVMAVFFGLALCILVSCLDSTIVATALPTISAAFDAGSVVSWVPSAYFLTSTAFQPLCECPHFQASAPWTGRFFRASYPHVLWSAPEPPYNRRTQSNGPDTRG